MFQIVHVEGYALTIPIFWTKFVLLGVTYKRFGDRFFRVKG